jgi:hypothetical protein
MAIGRLHPGRRFWGEIAVVLLAKAAALVLLYLLFFAEPAYVGDIAGRFFSVGVGE